MKRWMGAAALAIATVMQAEVQVQEELVITAAPLPKYRVEETTSGTLVSMAPEKAPFVVDTFTEDFIRERNAADLDQLVTLQPGVYQGGKTLMSRHAGTYTIRGYGGSEVMMGGVPMTGGIGVYLDPSLLSGVDIVKGPVGAAYGGQSGAMSDLMGIGGTIILRTKQPSFDENFWNWGVRGSYSKKSGSSFKVTSDANYTDEAGTYAARVPLAYSWRNPGWAPSGAGHGHMYSAAPSISWRLSEKLEMGLDLFYQYSNQPAYQGIRVAYGKPIGGMGWDGTYTRPGDRMRFQVHGGTFRIDGKVNDWLTLRTRASFFQSENRYAYRGPSSSGKFNINNPNTWYEYSEGDRLTRHLYLSQDAVFNFETGPVEHTFLAGVNLTMKENSGWSYFGTPKYAPEATTQRKLGINLQELAQWKGFSLIAGVRADWHDSVNHAHAWTFSPRFGLSYDILEEGWAILFANVSLTENPNFNLKRYGINDTNVTVSKSNYLNSTWHAVQKELGLRVNPVGSLWLTTTVFRIDQSNAPIAMTDDTTGEGYYSDEGKTFSQGVEFAASGDITEAWSAYVAYTYIDYYDKTNSRRFDRFPPHAISFWTSYKCDALGGAVLGLGGRWRDDWLMTMRGQPAGDQYRTKKLLTFDASIDIPLTEKVSCMLAVKNIFNSRGVESARNLQAFANDARTFELSVNGSF